MKLIQRMADAYAQGSASNQCRQRRFRKFEKLIDGHDGPLRILDVGGTAAFWRMRGWDSRTGVEITVANIAREKEDTGNITSIVADATDLHGIEDNCFDVVFSNSVIEHLFTYEAQAAMAREVQRVGKAYWVQTPNYWFPIEPHFHVVGWQWLPERVRVGMLCRRSRGWRGRARDAEHARQLVREVRLLTRREMVRLFPKAQIWTERVYGLPKSFVAYGGFDQLHHAEAHAAAASNGQPADGH